jgi:nucleotide-binding universal stress UspA family protein
VEEQLHRRTIVVGIDGSEHALRAVRWGAAEAERSRTPLRLVTAFGLLIDHGPGRPHIEERYRRALHERARGYLAAAAAEVGRQDRRIEVEQELIVGHPISVLGEESRHAQVVVIGDRGLSGLEGLLVGSVAVGLTVHAHCPVVVVRGPGRPAPDGDAAPVVVGVDGSGKDDAALAFAFEAAAARHAPLVAVEARLDLMIDATARTADPYELEAGERARLSARLAGWLLKYPDLVVEQVVAAGAATRILLEQASRAQLLVVGSRGRGEFAGVILGSVSHALLHRAPCPVAVVRPDPDAGGPSAP